MLPVFNHRVRRVLCDLWILPGRGNVSSSESTLLAVQNLNAKGDFPTFDGLRDGYKCFAADASAADCFCGHL